MWNFDSEWPELRINAKSHLFKKGGPGLFSPRARVEIGLDGELLNFEFLIDSFVLDFNRVAQASHTWIYFEKKLYRLDEMEEITFYYGVTYCKITYRDSRFPGEIIKILYISQDTPQILHYYYEIKWDYPEKSQITPPLLLHGINFTLGDPYYLYSEWKMGFTLHNRNQPNLHAFFKIYWKDSEQKKLRQHPSFHHLFIRQNTFECLKENFIPFSEDIICTKPNEENIAIFQIPLLFSETKDKTTTHFLISAGQTQKQCYREGQRFYRRDKTVENSDVISNLHQRANLFKWLSTPNEIFNWYAGIGAYIACTKFKVNNLWFFVPGHHYPRFYARDSYWQLQGILAMGDFDTAKILVETLFRFQHPSGSFPTSINFDGTVNQFTQVAADLDSTMFPLLSLADYIYWSGDIPLLEKYIPNITRAFRYLFDRDQDKDGWLEQGPNQDWADTMAREGIVAYSQGIYHEILRKYAAMFINSLPNFAQELEIRAAFLHDNFDRVFWDPISRRYCEYIKKDGTKSTILNQDVCLAFIFGLGTQDHIQSHLIQLKEVCWQDWGAMKQEAYSNEQIYGPKGFYHNGGTWLWTCCFEAVARCMFEQGKGPDHALEVLLKPLEYDFGKNPYRYIYFSPTEWFSSLDGRNQYFDYKQAKFFSTASGALVWAILHGFWGMEKNLEKSFIFRKKLPQSWMLAGTKIRIPKKLKNKFLNLIN